MQNQFDTDDDLPVGPNVNPMDESLARADQQVAGLSDDQVARKIGRRTTWFGRIAALLMIGIGGLLIARWYVRDRAYDHRWDVYTAAQEAGSREEFLAQIRQELPRTEFDDVRMRIMQKMGQYRDAEAVPVLIPFLDVAGLMRAHAARALAEIGSPAADSAKPALMRVLQTADERDRAPVVWALAVLGEAGATDAIIEEFESGRLQAQQHPPFDARVIVGVVGVQRLASPELTGHPSPAVRALVAQALAEAATPQVIEPLSRMLADPQNLQGEDRDEEERQNILRVAAGGLGRIGDPSAARPLFELMQRDPSLRLSVLEALRKSTGARGLAVLLSTAGDATTRRDLVTMLRATHDPAGADALAGAMQSDDEATRIEAATGLAELGDVRAVGPLLQVAQGEDNNKARDALDALMWIELPATAVAALVPILSDERYLGRRASVMKVIGKSRSREAESVLLRNLDGDDIGPAALALADLGSDSGFTTLMRLAPRPRNQDFAEYQGQAGMALQEAFDRRTAAVRALGRYGRVQAARTLMTIVEDPQDDVRLRNDAGLALGAVADDETMEAILAQIRSQDLDPMVRRFYLGALWQHPSRALSGALMQLLADPSTPPDVRRPTSVAIGYAADPANDARLMDFLENDTTQGPAALAIVLGGSQAAAERLAAKLHASDELRAALQEDLMNATNDWFNMVTATLWDSGQVNRRIQVAYVLNQESLSMAWQPLITRLRAGWGGQGGLSARDIRNRLFAQLRGEDAGGRAQAAVVLGAMSENGLLMAARDQGGPGSEEARAQLVRMNRPQSAETAD